MKKIALLLAAGALFAAALFAPPARALDLSLDGNLRLQCSTATASGNGTAATATLANKCGVITTEALTSPTSSNYALTLTNTVAAAADLVFWSVDNGTNSGGIPGMGSAVVTANTIVFNVRQLAIPAFNGTLKIKFLVVKP